MPFFGAFGVAWNEAMVAPWSANPLGMLCPELGARITANVAVAQAPAGNLKPAKDKSTELEHSQPYRDLTRYKSTLRLALEEARVYQWREWARQAHGSIWRARADSDRNRTRLFARYSFIGSIMAAVGALGAALPEVAAQLWGTGLKPALQAAFLIYAFLGGLALLLYRCLPRAVETADPDRAPAKPLGRSRRIVLTLAALFSLDAFAGGLSSSRCWRSGCSSASASRWRRPAPSSSGQAYSRGQKSSNMANAMPVSTIRVRRRSAAFAPRRGGRRA